MHFIFGVNSFISYTYNVILLCVCNLATFLLFNCIKFLLLFYSRVIAYVFTVISMICDICSSVISFF